MEGRNHKFFFFFNFLFQSHFDVENSTWSPLETEGSRPRSRDKLQAAAVGSLIYYFGGFGPKTDEAEVDDVITQTIFIFYML